jgi:hypothetical protein
MSRRRDLPGLTDESSQTVEEVREHLQGWRSETVETVDLLRAHRQMVEERAPLLENPRVVLEYVDFFIDLFGRIASELEGICATLPERVAAGHPAALRQIASNAAVEQRRCLVFRDKCINRPLPHEDVRPLLNQISIDTRDQLLDYRDLTVAAARLDQQLGAPTPNPKADNTFDRRALFSRFLPKRDQSG